MKKRFFILTVVTIFSLIVTISTAQINAEFIEFPIAVGPDSTFSAGAVYSGATGIVAIMGDTLSQYNITAQLISPPDSLIGNRISIGRQGTFPGPIVGFDGTNYFMVWKEFNGDVNGQFISTSGNLVGTYFTIGTNVTMEHSDVYGLCFGDTTYLVIFVKTDSLLYGQMVSKSGNLIGGQIQISSNYAREISLAYDGTNYLVTWVDDGNDKDIYGQFVSKTGSLVGSNFLIDGGPYYSDNPTSLAFDGTRYLLAYHESSTSTGSDPVWTLLGRFITTSGSLQDTITICDSIEHPMIPSVAFDGNNYLITWTQLSNLALMGRFWNPSGTPLDTPFVIFDSLNGKVPFGGCGFGGGYFLAVSSRLDSNFTDGDVYGMFISQTGVKENSNNRSVITDLILQQNTPDPFNSATSIQYVLSKNDFVQLTIYNISGQIVRTLVKGRKCAGTHTVVWKGVDDSGSSVRSGIYFYCLEAGNLKSTKKMLLMK